MYSREDAAKKFLKANRSPLKLVFEDYDVVVTLAGLDNKADWTPYISVLKNLLVVSKLARLMLAWAAKNALIAYFHKHLRSHNCHPA